MADPMIAFGNYADAAFLSGGSWRDRLPLTNLGNRILGRLARSTSASTLATWLDADVGVGRVTRVVSLLNHNFSLGAQYRLRASSDPTFSTAAYDSGWTQVWPAVYPPSAVEWEAENFWFGTYTLEEISGYLRHLIVLLPAPRRERYWRLEIDDAGNASGYVQAGRLFIGDAWQPINGVAFGASLAWEDLTTVIGTLSGADYPDPKKPSRVARLTTHFMDTDEAYSKAFEIQHRSGVWKEVVYIHDPDDTVHALRRRFPGRLRALGPLENPYPDAHQAAWEISEALP